MPKSVKNVTYFEFTTMAKKTSTSKKATKEKTVLEKIGDKATHLKEELVAVKDHLAEIAGNAIDAVKSTIENITHKKKKTAKKVKKSVSKTVKPAVKKPAKRVTAKSATPVTKKSAPAKKTTKKVAKKTTVKK
ncbi:MAG: hypothetical protein ABI861_08795 [Panacibacter sp.]